ncbi:hypothetical protein V6N11_073004 [Hibiscus sabdariffa]|uniref:Uncharacterized protein n=1 Tax=Hibiscus sabdariffa TaxID=183260 RepID=A0ABR2NX43_9ROSI
MSYQSMPRQVQISKEAQVNKDELPVDASTSPDVVASPTKSTKFDKNKEAEKEDEPVQKIEELEPIPHQESNHKDSKNSR